MKGTIKNRWVHSFVILTFVMLYFMVSIISTIHVIDFFELSNPRWLAISLAVAFEVGAAASLAAIVILEKTSRLMVWSLFIILTLMQAMGNTYYAFTNLVDFQSWIELFGLIESEPIVQKRTLAIVSGAILPIVALGFIKSLVDYIRPEEPQKTKYIKDGYVEDYLGGEIKKKELSLEEVIEEDKITEEVVDEGLKAIVEVEVPTPHYSPQPPISQEPSEDLKQRVKENQSKLVKLKDLSFEEEEELEEIEPPVEVEVVIEEPPVEVEETEPPVEVEEIEPNTRSISQPQPGPNVFSRDSEKESAHKNKNIIETENTKDIEPEPPTIKPTEQKEVRNFSSLKKIGKDWLVD